MKNNFLNSESRTVRSDLINPIHEQDNLVDNLIDNLGQVALFLT